MYNETSIFAIVGKNKEEVEIKKFEIDRNAQIEMCKIFSEESVALISPEIEPVEHCPSFRGNIGEILYIDGYVLNTDIIEAIREPISVDIFNKDEDGSNIISIFTGKVEDEDVVISFQNMTKSQYLLTKGIPLFMRANKLVQVSNYGITFKKVVDVIYKNGRILFKSFNTAKQIFDLTEYYRIATDEDVNNFIENDKICLDNPEKFRDDADTFIRRKITSIQDSRIFEQYSAREISSKGVEFGLMIPTVDLGGVEKLQIPSNKSDVREVLKFLDEEIYKGIFTGRKYETNSKRIIS